MTFTLSKNFSYILARESTFDLPKPEDYSVLNMISGDVEISEAPKRAQKKYARKIQIETESKYVTAKIGDIKTILSKSNFSKEIQNKLKSSSAFTLKNVKSLVTKDLSGIVCIYLNNDLVYSNAPGEVLCVRTLATCTFVNGIRDLNIQFQKETMYKKPEEKDRLLEEFKTRIKRLQNSVTLSKSL